jgi:hypothetical protein
MPVKIESTARNKDVCGKKVQGRQQSILFIYQSQA